MDLWLSRILVVRFEFTIIRSWISHWKTVVLQHIYRHTLRIWSWRGLCAKEIFSVCQLVLLQMKTVTGRKSPSAWYFALLFHPMRSRVYVFISYFFITYPPWMCSVTERDRERENTVEYCLNCLSFAYSISKMNREISAFNYY